MRRLYLILEQKKEGGEGGGMDAGLLGRCILQGVKCCEMMKPNRITLHVLAGMRDKVRKT